MYNPKIRWLSAGIVVLLIAAALFGRAAISSAYVNAATIVLASTQGQSTCALGLPYYTLQPAERERATTFLQDALRWDATNERAWRLIGEIALSQGDLQGASKAFAKVHASNTVFSTAQFWQAYAEAERGNTQQDSMVWASSGAEPFLLALGDCFLTNKRPEQAQRFYTFARDNAKSMVAYVRLGDLAASQDRWDEALASYQYVIDHSKDAAMLTGAYLGAGQVLARQEQAAEADALFDAAYALNPSASLASRIGIILRGSKQYERSNTWLMLWAKLTPTSPDPYRVLGTNALDSGQPAAAIQYFNNAIGRGGKSPELYYSLGLAYEQLGDIAKARQAYERVLVIDAGHTNAKKRLQALN